MESLLRADVSCSDCREAHYESGKDAPCDQLTEHPVREEWGHWCKYGLVELEQENWQVFDCWRFLRAFGNEAGMQLLQVRYSPKELAAMADDLLLAQGVTNRVEAEKLKTTP